MKLHPRTAAVLIPFVLHFLITPIQASTRIDVMMAYTPAVTEFYHGHDGVLAHLLATVAGANAVFENSDVPAFLHLVHAAEIDYVESGSISEDLDRLRRTSDGYMDEIHDWRNQWGADLVCLIRRGSAGQTAGMAYMLNSMHGSPAYGFSVVSDVAAMSGFTFAHEIGHNLGAAHAHGDSGIPGIFEYARGHRFLGQDNIQYRTVMAYSPGAMIPHFSNPDIYYEDRATGVPDGEPNPADVRATFSLTGPMVAGYRPAQSIIPEILFEPQDTTIVSGRPAVLGALVNGLPPVSMQWFEGPAGDTSHPVAGATDAVLTTDPLYSITRYWLRALNDDGVAVSRAATVAVVPPPPEPYDVMAEQTGGVHGYRVDREMWQQFEPSGGYLDKVGFRLWKVGDPGGVLVEIVDSKGFPLASTMIPGSSMTGWLKWHFITAGLFVAPGHPYRIRLNPDGLLSDDDYSVWAFVPGDSPPGSMSGYVFEHQLNGTDAWTYHTWLAVEGLRGNAAKHDFVIGPGALPNILRYVLNVDMPGWGGTSVSSFLDIGGAAYLPFRFRQRKAMQDPIIFIESSGDLNEWEEVSGVSIVQLPDADGGTEEYEARVPVTPGETTIFLRLNVSLPLPE